MRFLPKTLSNTALQSIPFQRPTSLPTSQTIQSTNALSITSSSLLDPSLSQTKETIDFIHNHLRITYPHETEAKQSPFDLNNYSLKQDIH
ncbi:hypothetical protein DID74_00660 [Candidatus Marinamargulisbacteria bacterium SCGC AG-333-B06]|nr:hypothetical protein DID74_00660 [Candidatus Marinamargulisbacteria bacterium SCGC AG-333-B06]